MLNEVMNTDRFWAPLARDTRNFMIETVSGEFKGNCLDSQWAMDIVDKHYPGGRVIYIPKRLVIYTNEVS